MKLYLKQEKKEVHCCAMQPWGRTTSITLTGILRTGPDPLNQSQVQNFFCDFFEEDRTTDWTWIPQLRWKINRLPLPQLASWMKEGGYNRVADIPFSAGKLFEATTNFREKEGYPVDSWGYPDGFPMFHLPILPGLDELEVGDKAVCMLVQRNQFSGIRPYQGAWSI